MSYSNTLIPRPKTKMTWIFIAFVLGYFMGGVIQSIAITQSYADAIRYLNKLGYKEIICR